MKADFYYFHRLRTQNEKELYMSYYHGVQNHLLKVRTNVAETAVVSLGEVHRAILMDHPGIFYLKSPCYCIVDHKIEIFPQYAMDEESINKYQEKLASIINSFIKQANLQKNMDKMSIMRKVHDMLAEKIEYDKAAVSTQTEEHLLFAHSVLGVLVYWSAVCDAIAKTYKLILNHLGIPCIIVLGCSERQQDSFSPTHAWNAIKDIAGNTLHVDVTWDIEGSLPGNVRRDYFALTDAEIRKTHFNFQL